MPDHAVPPHRGTTPGPDPAPFATEMPLTVVLVLTCRTCGATYEPSGQDLARGRAGCSDPGCGGWVFSAALAVPDAAGGAR